MNISPTMVFVLVTKFDRGGMTSNCEIGEYSIFLVPSDISRS